MDKSITGRMMMKDYLKNMDDALKNQSKTYRILVYMFFLSVFLLIFINLVAFVNVDMVVHSNLVYIFSTILIVLVSVSAYNVKKLKEESDNIKDFCSYYVIKKMGDKFEAKK